VVSETAGPVHATKGAIWHAFYRVLSARCSCPRGVLTKLNSVGSKKTDRGDEFKSRIHYLPASNKIFTVDFKSVVCLQVTITEVNLNKSASIMLPPTSNTTLSHWFVVHYGGHYRVTVQTDSNTAIPAKPVEYLAPPIQPPHQLHVLPERNGSYIVYWKEKGLPAAIANMT